MMQRREPFKQKRPLPANIPHYQYESHPEVPPMSSYLILEQLKQSLPQDAQDFCGVFRYQKEADALEGSESVNFCALGKVAELKVWLNKRQIRYQFEIGEAIAFVESFPLVSESLYYPQLFEGLSQTLAKAVQITIEHFQIDEEHQEKIQFFGGWKALKVTDELKEIAVFTLPKICINQVQTFEISQFVAPHVPPFSREQLDFFQSVDMVFQNNMNVCSIMDIPSRPTYLKKLAQVIHHFATSTTKIVLSRKKRIFLSERTDPCLIPYILAEKHAQVYDYSFQWEGEKIWFGVSPEVLLQKSKRTIVTKPLAGTTKKVSDAKNPQAISNFLNDPKENLEHELAFEQMVADLKEVCEDEKLTIHTQKNLFTLKYAHHIKSEIWGELKKGKSTFDVLGHFYPPATIWGVPKSNSSKVIDEFEPFERGFFTGGLGYFNLRDDSNFALVIRSGCLYDFILDVFVGGGIVKNSVPDLEWEEGHIKMTPFLSLIEEGFPEIKKTPS